jgi:tRNA(Arg) A34 adenosine deaminase TadA
MSKYFPMNLAIQMAIKGKKRGEIPVGCVILDKNGEVLSSAHNTQVNGYDPVGHAEINAIREACKKIKSDRLIDCSLYVTLEPCIMCASAISRSKVKKLFFGADDLKFGAINGSINFFQSKNCNHVPEIYDNISKSECETLINNFFRENR